MSAEAHAHTVPGKGDLHWERNGVCEILRAVVTAGVEMSLWQSSHLILFRAGMILTGQAFGKNKPISELSPRPVDLSLLCPHPTLHSVACSAEERAWPATAALLSDSLCRKWNLLYQNREGAISSILLDSGMLLFKAI